MTKPPAVTRSGATLLMGGRSFNFTGVNFYNALDGGSSTLNTCDYHPTSLTTSLANMPVESAQAWVIRFWCFQNLCVTSDLTAYDWSRLDALIAACNVRTAATGVPIYVLPVLENQYSQCRHTTAKAGFSSTDTGYKTQAWYTSGTIPSGNQNICSYDTGTGSTDRVTYKQFIADIVTRYANESTIFAWQLINEAEIYASNVTGTGKVQGTGVGVTLQTWANDCSTTIHNAEVAASAVSPHLISLGTIGTGQQGAIQTDYALIHNQTYIDLCEVHDYSNVAAGIQDSFNGLPIRLIQATAMSRPLFIGEFSTAGGGDDWTLCSAKPSNYYVINTIARANYYAEKLKAQRAAGVVGHIAWRFVDGGNGGSSPATAVASIGTGNPDLIPSDPALKALATYGVVQRSLSSGTARYRRSS